MINEEQSDKNIKNSKNRCFLNFFLFLFPSNEKGSTSILLRLLFYTILIYIIIFNRILIDLIVNFSL